MARIVTYPRDLTITDNDLLLGSDKDNANTTSNYKVLDLKNFILASANTGTVTGTGTPSTLTMWSAGGTGIEDSILKQEVGTAYATTKNLIVDGNIYQSNMGESVSIGKGALISGTSGTVGENVAIGENALTSLTTGTNNIAIGVDTLKNETTSRNNIAIGKKALELGSGNNNIGLGFKSLYASNVQDNNISIGNTNFEGTSATSITDNVIIGVNSAKAGSLSGSFTRNVMLGTLSGNNFTTSSVSNSVFIGYGSGLRMKGASASDIGIGRNAFSGGNSGFTSEGYNIAIGDSAQGSNQTSTKYSIKIGSDGGIAKNYATNISTVDTSSYGVNQALGEHSALVGGYDNSAGGIASFIGAGHGNTIGSTAIGGAILGGFNNSVTTTSQAAGFGSAGMALGSDLQVTGRNQVVIGRYNLANNFTKIIVGIGTNVNGTITRKNALELTNGGKLILNQYVGNNFPGSGNNPGKFKVLVAQDPGGEILAADAKDYSGQYQSANTSTISTPGFEPLGPASTNRFTKLTWTHNSGGTHIIKLPAPGASGPPTLVNKIVEFATDSTFLDATYIIEFRTGGSGATISGSSSKQISGAYKVIKFWSDGSNWFILNEQN